ncbi:O-antigen biosynthesis glycosyltransferase WbnK-like [Folsomia candida]|uniref:O-antigen biosynthesis glycosyltransferase WbnK-like n=1 Tax=Folsomia candida TaxID=158441 RepID=UPI001605134C|nr:O-antigen biosynthesis glycosyltransferase WbnK-like [Folsomia candida]
MTERHPSISAHKIVQLSPKDYCQSETFFEPYRSEIVTLFQLKPTPLHSNNNTALFHHYHTLITSTSSTSSIAVHIRRGDFVSTGNAVPLSYYVDGITYFNSVFKNPTFFIFSDEILTPKDKEKLGLEKNFCYVEGLNSAIMDFELMTICSHGLIGNSTFAWWAVYLMKNRDKIVLAASPNLQNIWSPYFRWQYKYLYYPVSWRKIEVKYE